MGIKPEVDLTASLEQQYIYLQKCMRAGDVSESTTMFDKKVKAD